MTPVIVRTGMCGIWKVSMESSWLVIANDSGIAGSVDMSGPRGKAESAPFATGNPRLGVGDSTFYCSNRACSPGIRIRVARFVPVSPWTFWRLYGVKPKLFDIPALAWLVAPLDALSLPAHVVSFERTQLLKPGIIPRTLTPVAGCAPSQ